MKHRLRERLAYFRGGIGNNILDSVVCGAYTPRVRGSRWVYPYDKGKHLIAVIELRAYADESGYSPTATSERLAYRPIQIRTLPPGWDAWGDAITQVTML